MPFITELTAEFIEDTGQIRLTSPLVYCSPKFDERINVPVGFESDGASIPRAFWTMVGTPLQPKVIDAAVVHDYLYRYRDDFAQKKCDQIFSEAMGAKKVNWFKRRWFYRAVRLGGRFNRNITKTLKQP